MRHAVAEEGRFIGQLDVPLTREGRRQLRGLGQKMSRYRVDAIYSSDLQRARITAESVARARKMTVGVRPGLREMHFGRWQGLSWAEVEEQFPNLARRWVANFPRGTIPGAENFSDFRRRVHRERAHLVKEHRGECVLVVTHAGVIRCLLARALGLHSRHLFRMAQDHCGLTVIDYLENGNEVRCING